MYGDQSSGKFVWGYWDNRDRNDFQAELQLCVCFVGYRGLEEETNVSAGDDNSPAGNTM